MALVCIFLSLLLGLSAAVPQDLSGKMLVFPQETNTAHVRLTTSRQNLGAVTVCMRYFTDLTRAFSFFSLSIPSQSNALLIYKQPVRDEISVTVKNIDTILKGQDFQINRWQSLCATWEAASGVVQLWIDGKPSTIKFASNANIGGPIIIVLGQDQDNYGGGFDKAQSFVGMMTDVHMWDYVLSPQHIDNYSQKLNFPAGNVLNWKSMEFQITGRVLIQKEQNK
ncbi:serum amyloid P-component-like [Boleophthalmus pectinirostris]|uniref:serum amyloid P-component-like n=1 Tax=Boleophthalmus pectinirostris TaxID=150288 RepID=UPI002430F098|nr:serum amyloid P-component-like [Boleophthalmus pectinirostris]